MSRGGAEGEAERENLQQIRRSIEPDKGPDPTTPR